MLCEKPYAMTTEVQPQYNNRSAAVASTVKPEIILYDQELARKCLLAKMCFEIPPYQSSNSKFDRRHSLKSRNSECLFSRNRSIVTIKYKKVYKKASVFTTKSMKYRQLAAYLVYFLYLVALMITTEGIKKFDRSNLSNLQFNFVSAISC